MRWCKTHKREATCRHGDRYRCDPKLGGITMPCDVVDVVARSRIKLILALLLFVVIILANGYWAAIQWDECRQLGLSVLYCIKHVF